MLDFLKLFFTNLHELPESLRYGFVALFASTAILMAVAFKRWLEARRVTKDTDFWAHVPVSLAVAQVLLWGGWASAGFYTAYVQEPETEKSPAIHAAGHGVTTGPAAVAGALAPGGKWHRTHHVLPIKKGTGNHLATPAAAGEALGNADAAQVGSAPIGIPGGGLSAIATGMTQAAAAAAETARQTGAVAAGHPGQAPRAAPGHPAPAGGPVGPVTIESAPPAVHRPAQRRAVTPAIAPGAGQGPAAP